MSARKLSPIDQAINNLEQSMPANNTKLDQACRQLYTKMGSQFCQQGHISPEINKLLFLLATGDTTTKVLDIHNKKIPALKKRIEKSLTGPEDQALLNDIIETQKELDRHIQAYINIMTHVDQVKCNAFEKFYYSNLYHAAYWLATGIPLGVALTQICS